MSRVRMHMAVAIGTSACLLALVVSTSSAAARVRHHRPLGADPAPDHVFKALARSTVSVSVTTTGPELLLAAASADIGSGTQAVTVTGGGVTWTRAVQENVQMGDAEIWTASGTVTGQAVSASASTAGFNVELTVMAFQNAKTGAVGKAAAAGGAPTVSVTATASGSNVYGVGFDWDHAIARTMAANNVLDNQDLTASGDTHWVQHNSVVTTTGAVTTLKDTAPTSDRYDLAAIEVAVSSPPPTTTTTMATTTTTAATTTTTAPTTTTTVATTTTTTVPATTTTTTTPPPPPNSCPDLNQAAACHWPDATNTGVPAGVTLTTMTSANAPTGSAYANNFLEITADNVVIDGFLINGGVHVTGHNDTISRSKIVDAGTYADGSNGVVEMDYNTNVNFLLVDSEIDGRAPNSHCFRALEYNGYTALRDNIHDCTDALAYVNGSAVIRDSYLHTVYDHNLDGVGIHSDVLQKSLGSNDTVIHNRLENHDGSGTSAWQCCTDQGPVSNLDFENNLIDASGWGVYGGAIDGLAHNPQLGPNVVYANNHFVSNPPAFKGPDIYTVDPAVTWTSDIWDDGVNAGNPVPRG